MRTAAIITYWDGEDLLPYAVKNWFKCVDHVIIVYSDRSNYGEFIDNARFLQSQRFIKCTIVRCEPVRTLSPVNNERWKRNFGLGIAREMGITHFVTSDADEFYDPIQFKSELNQMTDDVAGLCCASHVYFKHPTLTIGEDVTIVPFIHRMTPTLKHEFNPSYPFAFINKQIRIDPTRQFNIISGVKWSPIIMHHYSWVRSDIEQKIRNSTARANIELSNVRDEFIVAEDGYFLNFYRRKLYSVENRFNLPDYGVLVKNLRDK